MRTILTVSGRGADSATASAVAAFGVACAPSGMIIMAVRNTTTRNKKSFFMNDSFQKTPEGASLLRGMLVRCRVRGIRIRR